MEGSDLLTHSNDVWSLKGKQNNRYTVPVTKEEIDAARNGDIKLKVTDVKYIPKEWLPNDLKGKRVLALGSGGGQQGPLLAAAGADVTVLDLSPSQLERDEKLKLDYCLNIRLIQGDMTIADEILVGESFDLIINPTSTMYIRDIQRMYEGVYNLLKPGGTFIMGFMNPLYFVFDPFKLEKGEMIFKHTIPYDPIEQLDPNVIRFAEKLRFEIGFGHSLQTLIGNQCKNGFVILGFFEDIIMSEVDKYIALSFATYARKEEIVAG
jgi:SAM-dependent methyltransferase